MTWPAITAIAIFVVSYLLLAFEIVHKATSVMAGAVLMIILGIITQHTALHGDQTLNIQGVDWNTILLLVGMMVIVAITRQTGGFEWVAIKAAKAVRGHPTKVIMLLCIVTAILSAFLDNVTTVIVLAPVTILIFERLEADPVPALISIILASNFGGTATLIGDPPNIIIGSAARIPFIDFLYVDGVAALISMGVLLAAIALVLHPRIRVEKHLQERVMEFNEDEAITDPVLLRKCIIIFSVTLLGFVLHGFLGFEVATIALTGAVLLLLWHDEGPEEALSNVEWTTIFFFIGLFIMVSGLAQTGVVKMLGEALLNVTEGSTNVLTMVVLWLSGVSVSVINNTAYAAMMTPLIQTIAETLHANPDGASWEAVYHSKDALPLWWALSLGSCLGGVTTLVGSAANVVVAGIAESSGHPISFGRYLKYGIPMAFITLLVATGWLWLIFLR